MFEDLNETQRAAATFGEGPLLVVAGAGTGKTTTLAARVAHLLSRGVRPERLLLLTFSRRAAREMLARAETITDGAGRVWGGTFHAVGNRLLRLHGRALGLPPDFTVLDQGDAADLLGLLREELGVATTERRFARKETLAAIYSRTVNAATPLADVVSRHYPWCADDVEEIRELVRAYTERKRRQHLLDFDDLLLFWKALVANETTGPQVAAMFDHVLVDEYQDTNALQADILDGLRAATTSRNLTVVGDDAQAIYGFRAATVRNILEFPERFPGATVITLERNYRSTAPILAASNAVIARSPQRHEKTLWTDRDTGELPTLTGCVDEIGQAEHVCRAVLAHRERGTALKEQAVLFRAAHHSDLLEVELTRRNIPFVKYGGLKFLEAAHVKDALAMLRVLENPWDEVAWFRVLQLPEGIGPATARRLIGELGVFDPGAEPLVALVDRPVAVPTAAAEGLRELRSALAGCRDEDLLRPAAQVERIRAYLEPVLVRKYESPGPRVADLEQLSLLAQGYEARGRFLAELTLDPPASTSELAGPPGLDEDYLVLTTIHSAKGLEWDVVHVIHASDGNIPSDLATGDEEELEEERRLLYVALTRARRSLHVTFPQRFHHSIRRERFSTALVSRFLDHDEVRTVFERRAPDVDVREDAGEPVRGVASVDALLADLFG
ncbi:MAG TPA: ATP-dependent helicase [Actinomycetota bacterium]